MLDDLFQKRKGWQHRNPPGINRSRRCNTRKIQLNSIEYQHTKEGYNYTMSTPNGFMCDSVRFLIDKWLLIVFISNLFAIIQTKNWFGSWISNCNLQKGAVQMTTFDAGSVENVTRMAIYGDISWHYIVTPMELEIWWKVTPTVINGMAIIYSLYCEGVEIL